jgi:acyl dehydratase
MYDTRMPAEHAEVPLWGCEDIYWEDFPIGQRLRTIRRTITEGECATFNAMVADMHPYGCDEIFAVDEGLFGRRLVAGAMIFSIGIGMVATNWWQAFSYGYDRLRFIKIFIGDTIYTIRNYIHKEPKYEKEA